MIIGTNHVKQVTGDYNCYSDLDHPTGVKRKKERKKEKKKEKKKDRKKERKEGERKKERKGGN